MNPRRNILIFHQAALGDFVVTWPLAMALGRVFAQSRVRYVTGSDKGRLAEDAIGVEGLSADDGWHTLYGDTPVADNVARVLAGTQMVVLFAEDDPLQFITNLAKHAGDVPLIRIRPNPPPGVHVTAHHLTQLDGQGRLREYVEQTQNLIRTHGLGGRPATPNGDVLIHPGSGSPAKNWPLASFVEVAKHLRAAGRGVSFVLGEVERERFTSADLAALRAVAPVEQPADLPALRRVLLSAAGYVGNDSGPTHLAAAMGVPTVALFGQASDVARWQPIGPRVRVLAFDAEPKSVVDQV